MRVSQAKGAPPGRESASPGRGGGRAPRRVALARAAAALSGALLVVLLALSASEGEGPAPATSAERTPAQGMSAPILPPAPPAPTPDTAAAAARVAQAATAPAIVAAPASPAASLPVPAVAPAAGPERAGAGAVVAPAASVAPAAAPTATARVQGVLIPRAAAAAVGSGYLVQLGVFTDPANTLKAYEQAVALGQPAYVQSRVVLGPFADRAAAERARKALQGAGAGAGVLIAPERGR